MKCDNHPTYDPRGIQPHHDMDCEVCWLMWNGKHAFFGSMTDLLFDIIAEYKKVNHTVTQFSLSSIAMDKLTEEARDMLRYGRTHPIPATGLVAFAGVDLVCDDQEEMVMVLETEYV